MLVRDEGVGGDGDLLLTVVIRVVFLTYCERTGDFFLPPSIFDELSAALVGAVGVDDSIFFGVLSAIGSGSDDFVGVSGFVGESVDFVGVSADSDVAGSDCRKRETLFTCRANAQ